ncbi:hypothetical protein [Sulfitobacter sp.]|uniref:hypothetical protein n=1 Tax=Sulfitobacter sp. TaxID=1903071 RepID=UPI003002D057
MKFLEFLTDFNNWIIPHKELVTVIAVPALTYLVTFFSGKTAEKRTRISTEASERRAFAERKLERELTKRIKLANFRQAWINQVKEDFSLLISNSLNPAEATPATAAIFNSAMARIRLNLNIREDGVSELLDACNNIQQTEQSDEGEYQTNLVLKAHLYLKKEWDALKSEIDDIDNLEQEILVNSTK